MNTVLGKRTAEDQNHALFDALEQQGLKSFELVVECFKHSRENAAFLWVLEHEGGNWFDLFYSYSSINLTTVNLRNSL